MAHCAALRRRRTAAPPPPPQRPNSAVVARPHKNARARARGEGGGDERWRRHRHRDVSSRSPSLRRRVCVVASCVWLSRRRVSLSSRRDRRRVFSSSHEVTWREGRVRKAPARPTARSTDRLPYRPPLHARVALTWQSAESTRGLLWPCETITSATADRAHVRALVVRCPCHRAAGAVAARDCRARTGAHATLSSCRLTEAKSMITMVTW